jgi:hypothetical protein
VETREREINGVLAVPVSRVIGRWTMAATTSGYFDRRPRVDAATFEYAPATDRRLKLTVDYLMRDRLRRINGTVPIQPSWDGLYSWRGRGARFLAVKTQWAFTQTADGAITVLRNFGSMINPPGAIVLAREGMDAEEVRRVLAAAWRSVGLLESEYHGLSWR